MKNLIKKISVIVYLMTIQNALAQDWSKVELDSTSIFVVSKIEYQIQNAFDDVAKYGNVENWIYSTANNLRFKTRESVVQNNLLFNEGDSVDLKLINESERLLRTQIYLADAKIDILKDSQSGLYKALISTSDKWTTNIPVALSKESEWLYTFGIVEYNTLGYGHQIGAFYSKQLERNLAYSFLGLNHFLYKRNRLDLNYTKKSDGYSYLVKSERPLLESVDKMAYTAEWSESVENRYRYLDRNQDLNWVKVQSQEAVINPEISPEKGVAIFNYKRTKVRGGLFNFRFFNSGIIQQEYYGGYQYWSQTVDKNHGFYNSVIAQNDTIRLADEEVFDLWTRINSSPFIGIKLKATQFKKVSNFRKVKWSEDVEVGPWAFFNIYQNLKSLGARNDEIKFRQGMGFSQYWLSSWYIKASILDEFYLKDGFALDGSNEMNLESQVREGQSFSTVLNSEFNSYYYSPKGRYRTLGGFEGLTGFPDFYFSGASIFWFQLEQRWFPKVEWATTMPVLAAFVNGGQSARQWYKMPWDDLNYRVGLGMRLGLTKSTLGIVNHINISWPINGPFEKSYIPTLSIIAKTSL